MQLRLGRLIKYFLSLWIITAILGFVFGVVKAIIARKMAQPLPVVSTICVVQAAVMFISVTALLYRFTRKHRDARMANLVVLVLLLAFSSAVVNLGVVGGPLISEFLRNGMLGLQALVAFGIVSFLDRRQAPLAAAA